MRSLWTKLIEAIQSGIQYTHYTKPSQDDYSKILVKLASSIDEVRGVFCNLQESSTSDGYYPFEPLKTIHQLVAELGYGDVFDSAKASRARLHILALWKDVRRELLKEFDREEPAAAHSHWLDKSKAQVYDQHAIPKRPS